MYRSHNNIINGPPCSQSSTYTKAKVQLTIISRKVIEYFVMESKRCGGFAVAVKFGVGVALIVAAHFVLVRRWNNGKAFSIIYFCYFFFLLLLF